ncbi:MAG TPA: 2-phospho-L-lactate transferase [Dehalococcoidia bacterium]|nr:2-phospho-L-lactate transferase [Dehalococcoidia bacterium]
MITVLSGGVGAARFLQGLSQVVPQREITIIANTADDAEFYGLHVSPDIDIVLYHLAGLADEERGWGLRGDSFHAVDALERFGYETWFRLGDADLATCLHRTNLLRQDRTLSQATAEITRALGLECAVLPMSDDPVRTKVETADGVLDFQEYFVKHRAQVPVRGLRFEGAKTAQPAPGVLAVITEAELVVVAPSNPLVSIGPILAVPGIRQALIQSKAPVIAVSPIVAGGVIKGPADRMLKELGYEASATQIARLYADFLNVLVIDNADAGLEAEIEAEGVEVVVTDTIMSSPEKKAALARTVIEAAGRR